jgi:hypothetical protein
MPPRRKRRLINIQTAPGIKSSSFQVDPALLSSNWQGAVDFFNTLTPKSLLPALKNPSAVELARHLHSAVCTARDFQAFFHKLQPQLDKDSVLFLLVALQNDRDFKSWLQLHHHSASATSTSTNKKTRRRRTRRRTEGAAEVRAPGNSASTPSAAVDGSAVGTTLLLA